MIGYRIIDLAIARATVLHTGQVDKSGVPYIFHPIRVGGALAMQGYNERTVVAGILHDTVEDTWYTLEDVRHDFGPRVAMLVDAMTKREDEGWFKYLKRIEGVGPEAVAIKLADMRDNLARTRDTKGVIIRELEGLSDRYKSSIVYLTREGE